MRADSSTALGEWEEHNDRHLAESLARLRALLRERIAAAAGSPAEGAAHPDPGAHPDPAADPDATATPAGGPDAAPTRAAASEGTTAPTGTADDLPPRPSSNAPPSAYAHPPALVGLGDLLGLSPFERDTLLLCAAPEFAPGIADLYARAQGNPLAPHPTFALALSLFPDPAWDVLSPYRGLRYWRLVDIDRAPGQPLVTSPLRADERIVNHLKGLDHLDVRLHALLTPLRSAPADTGLRPAAARHAAVAEALGHWLDPGAGAADGLPVIQLLGTDRESKRTVAEQSAADCGLLLYGLPARLLPDPAEELDALARLWQREARLAPLALYLDADDAPAAGEAPERTGQVARFLERSGGPRFVATREARVDVPAPTVAVEVAPPPALERAAAWGTVLPPAEADRLAGQFTLDLSAIHEVATEAGGDPEQAWRGCLVRTRPRLGSLAQRLDSRVGWEDIVLPEEETALLRQIADQVAQRATVHDRWGFGERVSRGLGISALFTGPSGTGKTMAAEVLAGHLGLDLYRVDLSAAVSKYIGETEKNLRRLFDAAEPGGAILFFDEADALFGKRSEVKDSHDRYANIEVSYLLQQMEAYRGLAILATNQRRALDTAFLRRLRFIVPFAFPGVGERREMWARAFPATAPVEPLDPDRLAALPLSGGMIRNIALNAAFAAAAAGTAIAMPAVLAAVRAELRKTETPVPEHELTWPDPVPKGAGL
ncbi:ATP-binding protein [Streptomyces sp. NBC_01233]|uniref:ATP-binding protein n=1 Tax=Streptomyces sp. NBC_01233 TaxID=2903787 RepID=UPI002E113F62|nr:AAA family ATPase [Streptomyces sp. NBC_01233]